MERFTGRNEHGDLTLCGEQVYGNNQNLYNAISELEDYEKTGLEPDKVEAALHELERYRELGTVEELDEAAYNASL